MEKFPIVFIFLHLPFVSVLRYFFPNFFSFYFWLLVHFIFSHCFPQAFASHCIFFILRFLQYISAFCVSFVLISSPFGWCAIVLSKARQKRFTLNLNTSDKKNWYKLKLIISTFPDDSSAYTLCIAFTR